MVENLTLCYEAKGSGKVRNGCKEVSRGKVLKVAHSIQGANTK